MPKARAQATRSGHSRWIGIGAFVACLFIWKVLVASGRLSPHVLPSPGQVMLSFWELLLSGELIKHAVASLFRVTAGFYLAAVLGIPLGMLLGRLQVARLLMNPMIQFLRPISPLAWIPMAMLWFGIGDPPSIFLIFLASFFPLVVSTTIAVQHINPVYFQVAANFGMSRRETVAKILIPAIVPSVITSLRLTVTIAWLVVVAAEMIAVQSGLGYLILDARNALRMDYVINGMIAIGLIGLLLDTIMRRIGRIDEAQWGAVSR